MIYMLIFSSILILFNSAQLQPFPDMKLYPGELLFSGDKTYEKLKELVDKHPNRFIGSEASRSSAIWMKDEFSRLGLDVRFDEFDCYVNKFTVEGKRTPANYPSKEVNKQVRGINVVAVSSGKTEEAVIIGAHRDVVGYIQGAEDNGSGTVSLLELARVLCSQEHYYTYIFVSFDGEEVGKGGSIDFVKRHSNSQIKLAYILDMTGYKNANSIGFYPYMTAKGASPLWTLALGNNLLTEYKLSPAYWLPSYNPEKNTLELFNELFNLKIFGHINTDSAPFTEKNIPAIGVMAAENIKGMNNTGFGYREVHCADDTINNVSVKTLELTGRFSEQYIRSIELNSISRKLSSQNYIINGSKYLSPVAIVAFLILVFTLFGVLIYLTFRFRDIKVKDYIEFIRSQWAWVLFLVVYTAVVVLMFQVLRSDSIKSIPSIIRGGFLLLTAGLGGLYLVFKRLKYLRDKGSQFQYFINMQTGLLNHLYLLVFLGLLIFVNPFKVLCITVPLFLFIGRMRYQTKPFKAVWFILFGLWSAVEFIIMKTVLRDIIYDSASFKSNMVIFLCGILWTCTFIYGLCTPPVPGRDKTLREGVNI